MGVSTRKPWLTSLGVLLAAATLCAGAARAELALSTDTPGSIVVLPKVIADEARDTIIMLTNTSNMPLSVHCWYFDANNSCQPTDFRVDLTPRQPTVWTASQGRRTGDESPGIFVGFAKPVVNFQGELKCVEVDDGDYPLVRNALKGEAIIVSRSTGQTSGYNAIAFQGGNGAVSTCQTGSASRIGQTCDPKDQNSCCAANEQGCGGLCRTQLLLDGTHYASCPDSLQVTGYAQGASDFANGSAVRGELTLVPCTEDMNDRPISIASPKVVAQLRVVDEFELRSLSASVPFACWANISLGNEALLGTIFEADVSGPFIKTRIETLDVENGGLLGVFEEFHAGDGSQVGTAAVNLHGLGARAKRDAITVEDLR